MSDRIAYNTSMFKTAKRENDANELFTSFEKRVWRNLEKIPDCCVFRNTLQSLSINFNWSVEPKNTMYGFLPDGEIEGILATLNKHYTIITSTVFHSKKCINFSISHSDESSPGINVKELEKVVSILSSLGYPEIRVGFNQEDEHLIIDLDFNFCYLLQGNTDFREIEKRFRSASIVQKKNMRIDHYFWERTKNGR